MSAGDDVLIDGPDNAPATLLLAHGSGSGKTHPFLAAVAAALAGPQRRVVRFDFPYRKAGRTLPDKLPALQDALRAAVAAHGRGAVALAGKSLGGRVGSTLADELGVRALVCFGYPFHPPKNPTKLRTAHLASLATPTLMLQGERDPFGTRAEVAGYRLPATITVQWLPDGDHDLAPRRQSGLALADNLATATTAAATFLSAHGA
ncbi:MAG: alpha/beta fold hydrolase [Planctomycetes bacterium]|nr:alpha/beta fold hydrolase [Planctomycetota bacterium]